MAFKANKKNFFQKTTLTKRPDEIWLNFEGMYQVATNFVKKLSFRTFICFDWCAMQKALIWRMDEIKINRINYLEHILNDKPLASLHLVLRVEASQLCDTIKELSEGLTPEEIFLLIIENIDVLVKAKQYEYAGMIACIAAKFLEENLCQPDVYLQFSLFSGMQYLFQANPLIHYQYGEKLLNLLEGLKENPDLKAGAIKQFNCVLVDMMAILHHHPDSFNEENIFYLAQKVGENIGYLTAEKQEDSDIDSEMIIELIANFSSRLLATDHTKTIMIFIQKINENYYKNFTRMHLFYVIYLEIHEWLFEKTKSAENFLKEELTQVYFALKGKKTIQAVKEVKGANHGFFVDKILELKNNFNRSGDLTNLNNACTTYKSIAPVLGNFYSVIQWTIDELDVAKESNSAAGDKAQTLFKELSPILSTICEFQQFSLDKLSDYLEEEIKKKRENVEKTSVSITSLSVPAKVAQQEVKTGSKTKKKKKKSKRQKPKPLPEKKNEPVVVKSKKNKNKEQELYVQAFSGEPELLAKYQDILKNTRLACAGAGRDNEPELLAKYQDIVKNICLAFAGPDTAQEKKRVVDKRSRIKSLLDDALQKNDELIKEAHTKNKPLIVAYAYITAIEIDQMACINLNILPPIKSKNYIQSCKSNLKMKEWYIDAIEVSFRKLQALCDGYYAITPTEKAIIKELQSLVPILVSHWEKTVIEEANWKTYVANKAEFIEREIENINREINRLNEGKKKAIEDGTYFNNEKPTFNCAKKRFKLEERILQLQYLQRKTSSAAHTDKASLNINHLPQLQEPAKPENRISSDTPVLQGTLEEGSSKTHENQINPLSAEASDLPADETPVLTSCAPNMVAESQEDDLGTPPLNTPDITVPENECDIIVIRDYVRRDKRATIVVQKHVPGDECAIISEVPAPPPPYSSGQSDLTWLLSLNKNKEIVPSASPLEEGPIKEEHEKSLQESQSNHPSSPQNDNPVIHMPALGASSISPLAGSAGDSDNALIHLLSTLADQYSSIPSHPPVQNNPPLAVVNACKSPGENENPSTQVSPSNPTLQKKSLTFFPASKPAKYFYDEPKVLTNMLSSYFEQAIQFRLGLTLIEHKEHLIVIIYTNRVEDGLFLMDTPTRKDLQDIDLLTISKKNGNVPILIKVKDSNHYFIFGCLGNKPWKITRLWGEKSDIFIKLLDQTEKNRIVNRNKLSQDVLSELKKYHSFFVHFPQPTYNFFFDEKHVLQILNTRRLQICPGEINIKRGGSLQAPLIELIHNIAAKKGVAVPMISSNLSYPESVSPSMRLRS